MKLPRTLHLSAAAPLVVLLWLLMLESFVVKSVVFDRNDPIVAHYLFSGTAISLLLAHVAMHPRLLNAATRMAGRVAFVLLAVWLMLATSTRATPFELSAAVGFVLLVLCFYFTLPLICQRLGLSLRRLVLQFLLGCVLASVAMLVLFPVQSYEEPSLRFRGALISVAVACNVFFYACVYATWAAKRSAGRWRWIYGAAAALSFVLLLLTFTKTSILQAGVGVGVLLVTSRSGRLVWRRMAAALCLVASVPLATLPFIDLDTALEGLRIIDGNLLASRDSTWLEGLDRAMNNPVLGTGLLTKQTQGGTADLELSSDSYDSTFDAHSLGISLVEQGGLPFMLAFLVLLALPLWQFARQFGLREALQTPEFIIMGLLLPSMMFAGGDMVSLGSLVNRLQWLFLGVLALEVLHARRTRTPTP